MIFPALLVQESLPHLVDVWSTLCSGTGGGREGTCPLVPRGQTTLGILPLSRNLSSLQTVLHQCSQEWGHKCKQYSGHLHSATGSAKYSFSLPALNGYMLICIAGFTT